MNVEQKRRELRRQELELVECIAEAQQALAAGVAVAGYGQVFVADCEELLKRVRAGELVS